MIRYGFEDKVVVITGGSRGIGLEIARFLLQQRAKVVICGRKADGLGAAAAQLNGGDDLLTVQANIAREQDVENLFDAAVRQYGGPDILINNVGMNLMTASLAETELSVWNKIIETNLTGAFLCSRKAARIMKEKRRGKIVSVSSLAASKAAPGMVRTDFSKLFWSTPAILDQIVKTIPAGRIAEPADVVYPVLFLCSPYADYITGQTVLVDGGATVI
jgi:NAD(P)-dependent dehydrogenase (short-subunit alcohol dehydrogenase family)